MSAPDLPDNLELLLAEFARSGLRELHLRSGSFELFLSTDASASGVLTQVSRAPFSALVKPPPKDRAEPAAPPPDIPAGSSVVCAPNLGTFYLAPKPGAAPYVEVGQVVAAGDELCLIEVMKLFTAVHADIAGTIVAILAEDGAMVDAGAPLFAVGPA